MYTPFSCHTHYSLLKSAMTPDDLISECVRQEIKNCSITDFSSLSGSVKFVKKALDNGIKPIIGTKVFCKDMGGYFTLVSMNKNGWKELCNISSADDINIETLCELKNVIVIDGDCNSSLHNMCILNNYAHFAQNVSKNLSNYLDVDFKKKFEQHVDLMKNLFGDRYVIGVQKTSAKIVELDDILANAFIEVAKLYKVKVIALPDIRYVSDEQKDCLRILTLSEHNASSIQFDSMVKTEDYGKEYRYWAGDYKFVSYDEMLQVYDKKLIDNTNEIADMCEQYSILSKPMLPKFDCPDNLSEIEYLKKLCRDGWRNLSHKLDKSIEDEYVARVKKEFGIIEKANLAGYFLIVQDYVNWAKQRMLTGVSRGSAGGCLVSYLTGIIGIDPVRHKLTFERFYNEGRNSADHISLPDIDTDFPPEKRESVMNYIRSKYGKKRTSQVITFSRLQGRSAIRETLRCLSNLMPREIDELSKLLPQESKIQDKLEEEKETSIIRWTLRNEPKLLEGWVTMDDNEEIHGELATMFNKAILLEGIYKNSSKHASALLICDKNIEDVAPMVKDKSGEHKICSIEHKEVESMGIAKLDILGSAILTKLAYAQDLLRGI